MKFKIYKEMVLAKTSGQNIHDTKAALGFLSDIGYLLSTEFYNDKPERKKSVKKVCDGYLLKIGKETGVKYIFSELDFSK